jgi:hypothetical protein
MTGGPLLNTIGPPACIAGTIPGTIPGGIPGDTPPLITGTPLTTTDGAPGIITGVAPLKEVDHWVNPCGWPGTGHPGGAAEANGIGGGA